MPEGERPTRRRPASGPERAWFGDSARRAVTDVVGYVLVFSLVVSVVALVSVTGFGSLEDARSAEQANNAERAFDVLSDNVADIYADGAPSRATEISLRDATVQTSGTIIVNVTAHDTTSNAKFTFEKTSRPVVWEGTRDTEIVYSLGTTLRDEPEGGVVLEPGPFRFDTERTVLRVVQLRNRDGQSFSGSTVRIRAVRDTSNVLLTERTGRYDKAFLNITTPRAAIWQAHLDRYPDTDCSVESRPAGETVVCELDDREELFVTLTRVSIDIEG